MKVKILIRDRAKGSPSNPALEHALAKEPRLRRGGRIWRYGRLRHPRPFNSTTSSILMGCKPAYEPSEFYNALDFYQALRTLDRSRQA